MGYYVHTEPGAFTDEDYEVWLKAPQQRYRCVRVSPQTLKQGFVTFAEMISTTYLEVKVKFKF